MMQAHYFPFLGGIRNPLALYTRLAHWDLGSSGLVSSGLSFFPLDGVGSFPLLVSFPLALLDGGVSAGSSLVFLLISFLGVS